MVVFLFDKKRYTINKKSYYYKNIELKIKKRERSLISPLLFSKYSDTCLGIVSSTHRNSSQDDSFLLGPRVGTDTKNNVVDLIE